MSDFQDICASFKKNLVLGLVTLIFTSALIFTSTACSDPEIGSYPKMKGNREEIQSKGMPTGKEALKSKGKRQ